MLIHLSLQSRKKLTIWPCSSMALWTNSRRTTTSWNFITTPSSMTFRSPPMNSTLFAVNTRNFTLEMTSLLKIIKNMKATSMLLSMSSESSSRKSILELYSTTTQGRLFSTLRPAKLMSSKNWKNPCKLKLTNFIMRKRRCLIPSTDYPSQKEALKDLPSKRSIDHQRRKRKRNKICQSINNFCDQR